MNNKSVHIIIVPNLGVRLYFTTTPNGEEGRPSLLALVHVRLPPGFSPSSVTARPGTTIHHVYCRKGKEMEEIEEEERGVFELILYSHQVL